jgi:hypothetical protein
MGSEYDDDYYYSGEDDDAWKRQLNEALAEEARAKDKPKQHDAKAFAPDSAPQVTFMKSAALQAAHDKIAADLQVKFAQIEAKSLARKAQLAADLQVTLVKNEAAKVLARATSVVDWDRLHAQLQLIFAPVPVVTPVTQDAVQLQPLVKQDSVEDSAVTLTPQEGVRNSQMARDVGFVNSEEQQVPFALKAVQTARVNNEKTPDSFVKEDVLVKKDIDKPQVVMDAVNLELTQDPFVPKDVVKLITTGGKNVRRCGARVRSGYLVSIRVP